MLQNLEIVRMVGYRKKNQIKAIEMCKRKEKNAKNCVINNQY